MKLSGEVEAAYLASAFWGMLMAGRLVSIPIASRVRPRYVLLGDLLGCLASLGLICLLPGSRLALWAGTLGMGLFMASIFPTNLMLASRRLPLTGRITGLFLSVASLGSMFLPGIVGPIFQGLGPRAAMVTFWIDVAVMLGVWAALMLRTAQAAKPAA